jgi:hypothetical protein
MMCSITLYIYIYIYIYFPLSMKYLYVLDCFHPSPVLFSGLIVILGLVRGELKHLWNYGADELSSSSSPSSDLSGEP